MLKSEKKVLLDFYADWCVPCQMMMPEMEGFAEAEIMRAKGYDGKDVLVAMAGDRDWCGCRRDFIYIKKAGPLVKLKFY